MDPRVATAPTPGAKKFTKTNVGGSSCLLRQPSNKIVNKSRPEATAVTETHRPNTCPVPTLTPQFHWNLNNSALKTLTQNQVNQLYGLFKFYDSSAVGDDLPSINCARLVEILRDARLINESSSCSIGTSVNSVMPSTRGLQVDSIERIFAQAVMGKMRVYLDADGQPALTFPLFCGALMNCAMLLTPVSHPEAALRQILPILLEGSIVNGHHISTDKGILGLFPKDGAISLWMPGQLQDPHQSSDDFRESPPFQQVIADCTRDKALEELKQEKLTRCYHIPDRLLASFHRDTIALVSNKFRTFDVFDRGTLPRQEVFPLLSSVGRRADLPDPYAILANLSASSGPSSEISGSGGGELTLAQLLQAIEATRESKRHSIIARLGAMKVNNHPRVDPAAEDDSALDGHLHPVIKETADDDTGHEHTASFTHHHGNTSGSTSKERKKLGVPRSRSRRSMLSQPSPGGSSSSSSSHSLIGSKHRGGSKNRLTHHASTTGKKKMELHRKSSTKGRNLGIATTDSESHGSVMHSIESGSHSHRSNNSDSSDYQETTGSFTPRSEDFSTDRRNSRYFDHIGHMNTASTHVHESSSNSKTLRIFLLLGGDHDGAICCTLSLKLATREIVESEGTYYSAAPSEITRATPVLPTQNSLTNALLLLKKCVSIKQERGFELRPANQLAVVDEMLLELKKREPRFSIALKPGPRASLAAGSMVNLSPANPADTMKAEEEGGILASSSLNLIPALKIEPRPILSSPSRQQKALSLPKPAFNHQYELPGNYRDVVASWEVSKGDDCAWIHAVNAASPLKPASPLRTKTKPHRSGHLSPLRLPHRQDC